MTTGSVHGTDAERKWAAARTRWWNSTGGGSQSKAVKGVNASARGIGAVKQGDGGVKFRSEWPELDAQNVAWMKQNRIDVETGNLLMDQDSTASASSCSAEVAALRRGPGGSGVGLGAVVGGGQAAREAGQSWVRRHKFAVGALVVIGYVLLARLMGEGNQTI